MINTGSMFSHIECTSCKKIFSKGDIPDANGIFSSDVKNGNIYVFGGGHR